MSDLGEDHTNVFLLSAISLVNSSTAYAYDQRTHTFGQPTFAHQTLRRFADVNAAALKSLQTQRVIDIERRAPLPANTPLMELINIGLKDQSAAPTVLDCLLAELGTQTSSVFSLFRSF
jgi:small subunit ribosomal protein S29